MSKLVFKNNDNQSVNISKNFIEKFMPKANGTFVKVYLYGLMHSFMPHSELTNNDIAQTFDILESDVINAWKYWEKAGAIRLSNDEDTFSIDFLDLNKNDDEKVERPFIESKPTYDPQELSIYIDNNSEISHLYKVAQSTLGKTLSIADSSTLFSFYDWLRLPVEVIIMLLEYCSSIGQRNLRYIEKVAIDWADKGIDTAHKAEDHLKKLELKNSNLNIIRNALGISEKFTDAQLKYINKWLYEYNLDVEVIRYGCERTILNTGKAAFPYLDSILKDWHDKGLKTLDKVVEDSNRFKEKNKEKFSTQDKKPVKTAKNNKFINFTQEKTDYDELMKAAREKRLNEIKESRSS